MSRENRIVDVRITPIAFRDGPLLNAAGIHEPWALRAIVEFEASDGRVGISETYGDEPMLRVLAQAKPLVLGLSPFDLNRMEERVRATIRPSAGAIEFELAPGSHTAKNASKVTSTFEVAMLDLQGQIVGAPVVDLLGGAVRDAVPYSAYLFYKFARPQRLRCPTRRTTWGESAQHPRRWWAQARRMIDAVRVWLRASSSRAGCSSPEEEIRAACDALRAAFPGMPLRHRPQRRTGRWRPASPRAAGTGGQRSCWNIYEDPVTHGLAGNGRGGHVRTRACPWPPTWSSPPWTTSAGARPWAR